MASRGIVKLRRGLLLSLLVEPTRSAARRASVASTEVSKNRIHGSNASSLRQCPPVADEDAENIRTTSMMDDSNVRALTPLRQSSNAVLSPRLFSERSPSARASKGFLVVGTRVTARKDFSTHPSRLYDELNESKELTSLLGNTWFKSPRQFRLLIGRIVPRCLTVVD